MRVPAHNRLGLFFAIFSGTKVLPGFSQSYISSRSGGGDAIVALSPAVPITRRGHCLRGFLQSLAITLMVIPVSLLKKLDRFLPNYFFEHFSAFS